MKFSEADGTKNVAIISKCCCISDISQLVKGESADNAHGPSPLHNYFAKSGHAEYNLSLSFHSLGTPNSFFSIFLCTSLERFSQKTKTAQYI